jgi:hypothetical protein
MSHQFHAHLPIHSAILGPAGQESRITLETDLLPHTVSDASLCVRMLRCRICIDLNFNHSPNKDSDLSFTSTTAGSSLKSSKRRLRPLKVVSYGPKTYDESAKVDTPAAAAGRLLSDDKARIRFEAFRTAPNQYRQP